MADLPRKVKRDLGEQCRKAVHTFDKTIREQTEAYDAAFLTGDDDERDNAAFMLLVTFIIAVIGLNGTTEKVRLVMDTAKAMEEGDDT